MISFNIVLVRTLERRYWKLAVSVLLFVVVTLLPPHFSAISTTSQSSKVYYRGSNYETWTTPLNKTHNRVQWNTAPQYVWNGSFWVPYVYERDDAKKCYRVKSGLISGEIYDSGIAKFFDVNMTEERVKSEVWQIWGWDGSDWKEGTLDTPLSFDVIQNATGVYINTTRTTGKPNGELTVLYCFRAGESLKHWVFWESTEPLNKTVQVRQTWDLAGFIDKVKVDGEEKPSGTHNGTRFLFYNETVPFLVLEDQSAMFERLLPTTIDFAGKKVIYTFSNWTLAQGKHLIIDPTIKTYYVGTGDGWVTYVDEGGSWDNAHDAESGTSVSYIGDPAYVSSYNDTEFEPSGWSVCERVFLPFDTSSLPDTVTIQVATLNIRCARDIYNHQGVRNFSLVQTTQASVTELVLQDFNQCGAINNPVEGANRKTITHAGWGWIDWTLNATGIGWINKTGWTKLGIRTWQDCDDIVPIEQVEECEIKVNSRDSGLYKPYLVITYVMPIPVIGEFEAASTIYAYQEAEVNVSVSDPNGKTTLKNASVTFSVDSVVLKWINSTNTFSMDDPSNRWELVSGARNDVNTTAYKLTWAIKSYWNATEGYVSITSADVYDEDNNHGTNSKSDWFYNENDLIIGSASVDDTDRVDPSQALTFSGQIYYEGTSTAPYSVSGVTAKVELSGVLKGSNGSISSDGSFTIECNAESTYGLHSYNVYCSTDENSVQNQTVNVIVERLVITIVADSYGPDVGTQVNFTVTAVYDYDDSPVNASDWTANILRNATHFATGNFTDTQVVEVTYSYTTENVTETAYGLTAFSSNTATIKWGSLIIEINELSISDAHVDLGTQVYVHFHSRFSLNQSDCTTGTLYVNGTGYDINGTGWITFSVTNSSICKKVYVVTGADVNGETDYFQMTSNAEIVWNKLQVTFGSSKASPTKGESVTISWTIKRLYDQSVVTDFNIDVAVDGQLKWADLTAGSMSDVCHQTLTRTYDVHIDSVIDNTYGLTLYTSQKVTVHWVDPPPIHIPPVTTQYVLAVMIRSSLGDPVEELDVEFYLEDRLVTSATTGADGTCSVVLPAQTYRVVVYLDGETISDMVELSDNATLDFTVPAAPAYAMSEFATILLVVTALMLGMAIVPRILRRR